MSITYIQNGLEINGRNTWCMIFKWDSFDIKLHIYSLQAIENNLSQYITVGITSLHSLRLEVGVTVFLSSVCSLLF